MYNYEKYEDLIQAYSSEKDCNNYSQGHLLSPAVKSYSDQILKTPDAWNEINVFNYFTETRNFKINTVYNQHKSFSDFYDYLIEQGLRNNNPCDSELTKPASIIYSLRQFPDYYSDQDIENIMRRIEENKTYNCSLVLTYYEGVALSTVDIMNLKRSDFNHTENTIKIPAGTKHISQRLSDYYSDLENLSVIIGDSPGVIQPKRTPLQWFQPDQLFPATSTSRMFFSRRLATISNITLYELHPTDLYYSGFLNYISRKIGKDRCIEIVLSNKRSDYAELLDFADEYLFRVSRNKLRSSLRRTALAMKGGV